MIYGNQRSMENLDTWKLWRKRYRSNILAAHLASFWGSPEITTNHLQACRGHEPATMEIYIYILNSRMTPRKMAMNYIMGKICWGKKYRNWVSCVQTNSINVEFLFSQYGVHMYVYNIIYIYCIYRILWLSIIKKHDGISSHWMLCWTDPTLEVVHIWGHIGHIISGSYRVSKWSYSWGQQLWTWRCFGSFGSSFGCCGCCGYGCICFTGVCLCQQQSQGENQTKVSELAGNVLKRTQILKSINADAKSFACDFLSINGSP